MNAGQDDQHEHDASCLFLINQNGSIEKLTCPISVFCNKMLGNIPAYTTLSITEVKSNQDNWLIYIIDGMPYYHNGFFYLYDIFRAINRGSGRIE